jgi:hypothetical protein
MEKTSKRAVSLNITVEATPAQMCDEVQLRKLCMKRMHEILGTNYNPHLYSSIVSFEENVTIEQFDENVEDED